MLDVDKIKTILQIQGLNPSAHESSIKAALAGYQYNDADITEALTLLKNDVTGMINPNDCLHKILRTDDSLTPAEISSMLGIDITISEITIRKSRQRGPSLIHHLIVIVLTVIVAAGSVLYFMYANHSGPFHPLVVRAQYK